MLIFWLISSVFFALAIIAILYSVFRHKDGNPIDQQSLNVGIAKEQLEQLENLHEKNEISDDEFKVLKYELESNLMSDISLPEADQTQVFKENNSESLAKKLILAILVVFIPLFSSVFYHVVGEPGMVAETKASQPPKTNPQNMDQILVSLIDRLKQNPEDIDGWFLLARTLMALEKYEQAYGVYEKLRASQGEQPDILVSMADALAMMQGGKVSGKPEKLLQQVLTQEPENITALWLSGIAAREGNRNEEALKHWRKLIPLLSGDNESLNTVKNMMAELGENFDQSTELSKSAESASTEFKINIKVDVTAELKSKLTDDLLVFIYAKAVQGPPMPLAVVKKQLQELPVIVTLDDSMAMMPTMKLSNYNEVFVGARVSMNGRPIKQAGDYMGTEKQVNNSEQGQVNILIDQIVN